MTDEVKRVVAGLRYCCRHITCKNLRTGESCPDYDSCQKKVADNVSRNESLAELIESLAIELEQVKQERDAAVQDLNACCPCEVCTRSCTYDKVNAYDECADFQWRGPGGTQS